MTILLILAMSRLTKANISRKANLTSAGTALEQKSDEQILKEAVLESQTELHKTQAQLTSLKSELAEKVASCSELSISLGKAESAQEDLICQLTEQKSRYQSLYKELRLEHQGVKCAYAKQNTLEQKIFMLKSAASMQSQELRNMYIKAQKDIKSVLQLEAQNSVLTQRLSQSMQYLQTEALHCRTKLGVVEKNLSDARHLC